jgi:hypothetical protein
MEKVSRYLIGSSNINRYYKVEKFPNFAPCVMQKCCNIETFKVLMEELDESENEVMISVIENFICDEVDGEKEEKRIDEKVKKAIDTFLRVVQVTSERLKKTKFAVCQPILRPRVGWYTKRFQSITKSYSDGVCALKASNVAWIKAPLDKEQIFIEDKIHLTEESGVFLIESLMSSSNEFFKAKDFITIDENMEDEEDDEESESETPRLDNVEKEVSMLKSDILARRHFDSLVTARLCEAQDTELNKSREDRIVINGLTNAIPMPILAEEKEKWKNEMVAEVVNSIVPGSAAKIVFVNLGGNRDRAIPLCEVKFADRETAIKIRKDFAAKKKGGHDYGRLGIFNSVTLATRVRIEILWAMAKKIQNEKETATVLGYSSRPTLQVKDKSGQRRPLSLGFADSLMRYGKMLKEGDLVSAYKKAGTSFAGLLQQNFVVMHDLNRTGVGAWGGKGPGAGGNPKRSGKKRPRNQKENRQKPKNQNGEPAKAARKE